MCANLMQISLTVPQPTVQKKLESSKISSANLTYTNRNIVRTIKLFVCLLSATSLTSYAMRNDVTGTTTMARLRYRLVVVGFGCLLFLISQELPENRRERKTELISSGAIRV